MYSEKLMNHSILWNQSEKKLTNHGGSACDSK